MDEMYGGGFRNPGDTHTTKIARIWRKVRPDRSAHSEDVAAPRGYETSYDVAHGYSEDRPIIRP